MLEFGEVLGASCQPQRLILQNQRIDINLSPLTPQPTSTSAPLVDQLPSPPALPYTPVAHALKTVGRQLVDRRAGDVKIRIYACGWETWE